MKKLIQVCTILSLIVTFSALSAFARPSTRFDAKIPFDFNIGDKSYPAGTYVIKVSKASEGARLLVIEDQEGNQLGTVFASTSGEVHKGEPVLVFNNYDNQRFLSKIVTKDSGLDIPATKTEKRIAEKNRENNTKTQIAFAAEKQ